MTELQWGDEWEARTSFERTGSGQGQTWGYLQAFHPNADPNPKWSQLWPSCLSLSVILNEELITWPGCRMGASLKWARGHPNTHTNTHTNTHSNFSLILSLILRRMLTLTPTLNPLWKVTCARASAGVNTQ